MKQNMGFLDTFIRVIAAIVIFMLAIFGIVTGVAAIILTIIGITFLVTSMTGTCLLYLPFNYSTKRQTTED